eukprot:6165672-Pyramimonas_sp.AAC.1
MRSYAHVDERTPGNIGCILSHGHRTETVHAEANAGQPANNVWNDDPQPTQTTYVVGSEWWNGLGVARPLGQV